MQINTQAIDGTPCDLEFNFSLGANASFTFTAHAVYLPIPRIEIAGPQGMQASAVLASRYAAAVAAISRR